QADSIEKLLFPKQRSSEHRPVLHCSYRHDKFQSDRKRPLSSRQQQQLHIGSAEAKLSSPAESPSKPDVMRPERLAQQYVDINGDVLVLSIDKRGRPALGLSLAGNRDASVMSIFVCGIRPDSAAATDGRLRIGDELLEVDGHVLQGKSHLNAVPIINDACSGSSSSVRLVVVRRPTNISAMAYWETNQKQPDTLITPTEMEMLAEGAIDTEQLMLIGKTAEQNGQQHRVGAYGLEIDCVLVKGKLGLGFAITEMEDIADVNPTSDGAEAVQDDSAGRQQLLSLRVLVKHITERGPAEIEGSLRPGDRLLRANGVDLAEAAYDEALDCLRSLPAGEVRLTVARQPQQQPANESAEPPDLDQQQQPQQQQQQQQPDMDANGGEDAQTVRIEINKGEAGTLGIGIVGGCDTE
uniref:PDZ domain-containing protein n=1 Tax=Macrostomum lignano TaxID=282301 RepID=A0A1I8FLR2_9PLAT